MLWNILREKKLNKSVPLKKLSVPVRRDQSSSTRDGIEVPRIDIPQRHRELVENCPGDAGSLRVLC